MPASQGCLLADEEAVPRPAPGTEVCAKVALWPARFPFGHRPGGVGVVNEAGRARFVY